MTETARSVRPNNGIVFQDNLIPGRRLDIVYCATLLLLVYLFYYPTTELQFLRYLYYADLYERFGGLINPDYQNYFVRWPWENLYPFSTLLYGSLFRITGSWWCSIMVLHLSVVTIATLLVYWLTSLHTGRTIAFLIAATIVFGRVHLGLARGLGCSYTLLIYPVCLGLLYLVGTSCRDGEVRLTNLKIALCSLLFALGISLGGHESLTFIAFFVLTFLIYGVSVFVNYGSRSLIRYLTILAIVAVLGLAFWVMLSYIIYINVPAGQRTSYTDILLISHHIKGALKDIHREQSVGFYHYLQVLNGAFVYGGYLTDLGGHHANTFVAKGWGFDGVIPIYGILGVLTSLVYFVAKIWENGKKYLLDSMRSMNVFDAFIVAMVILFVAVVWSGGDPKPTRLFLSVFAVYYLGYRGIIILANLSQRFYKHVIVALLLVFSLQVAKNFVDMKKYYKVYERQVPVRTVSKAKPRGEKYDNFLAGLMAVNAGSPCKKRKPALGLVLKFPTCESR